MIFTLVFLDINSDSIGFNNNRNGISRPASSSEMASRFSKIPPNHPVLVVRIDNSFQNFKRPRYVEKLHFQEDVPNKSSESDPIIMNSNQDTYYQPFMNKAYSLKARKFINCEDITSSFVCESTGKICGRKLIIQVGTKDKMLAFIYMITLTITV